MRRSRQPRDPDGASSDNRRTHRYRVSIYSVRLAEAVGLDAQAIQAPIKGAFLHDVGKIGVPDHILLKPGKLNDEEYAEMEKHVAHGLDIVHRAAWLADAEAVVGYHHEKYGGGGYDGQLKTDAIPHRAHLRDRRRLRCTYVAPALQAAVGGQPAGSERPAFRAQSGLGR